jgi:hypothetical protein
MKETNASQTPTPLASSQRDPRSIVLDLLIILLVLLVGYLSFALVQRHLLHPPVEAKRSSPALGEIIQIDVLNGCGISGAAMDFTAYLRARGYDVVEMRNYKTFDVSESLVIDRIGDLETARKVAYALGVKEKNIVQQLNEDYYVDVSVVIGKDYSSLKPSH